VRRELAHDVRRCKLRDEVEPIASDPKRRDAEAVDQRLWSLHGLGALDGEGEMQPIGVDLDAEGAAGSREADSGADTGQTKLAQDVDAGEGGVPAEIDLDRGG
jgi:hypothetical protein